MKQRWQTKIRDRSQSKILLNVDFLSTWVSGVPGGGRGVGGGGREEKGRRIIFQQLKKRLKFETALAGEEGSMAA